MIVSGVFPESLQPSPSEVHGVSKLGEYSSHAIKPSRDIGGRP
jgi:hypothetical protein